ncbi:hypothetical protein CEXT_668281 [Caerostris extrusa]|uniref:Uncharacterized protein n=1 Tax=Caerostris extrusa TaxID=172846 RepID=A0AAV4Q9J6_CAEEX|nr:hypothetical protein CEXT_668281 [Caerostris extrusa]
MEKYRSSIQTDDPYALNQHGGAETLNHVLSLCGILHKLSINRTTCLIKHRRSRLVNTDWLLISRCYGNRHSINGLLQSSFSCISPDSIALMVAILN